MGSGGKVQRLKEELVQLKITLATRDATIRHQNDRNFVLQLKLNHTRRSAKTKSVPSATQPTDLEIEDLHATVELQAVEIETFSSIIKSASDTILAQSEELLDLCDLVEQLNKKSEQLRTLAISSMNTSWNTKLFQMPETAFVSKN
ncbi:hypothetical protein BDZ45DRAFT_695066 [Acephala macrosclerotiorum]|nr:hypothetical protein BDZ45DRAFT_695066 [Acephala macrosclerotiorum]